MLLLKILQHINHENVIYQGTFLNSLFFVSVYDETEVLAKNTGLSLVNNNMYLIFTSFISLLICHISKSSLR